jgi:hypothetical protein
MELRDHTVFLQDAHVLVEAVVLGVPLEPSNEIENTDTTIVEIVRQKYKRWTQFLLSLLLTLSKFRLCVIIIDDAYHLDDD